MKIYEFKISGMSCAACSAAVERVTRKVSGVDSCSVNLATERMRVRAVNLDTTMVENAVKNAGFGAKFITDSSRQLSEDIKLYEKQAKARFIRLIISICFSFLLMYVGMGHMIHLPVPFSIDAQPIPYALCQILLLIPILVCGKDFYVRGFKNAINLHPNMDTLIALGTVAAILYSSFSLVSVLLGNTEAVHEMYWESAGTIVTLVMLGKYFEFRSMRKTSDAIRSLMELSPDIAHILDKDGSTKNIPVSELMVKDYLLVYPGERIPTDGILKSSQATVDESMLTGESMPIDKIQGDSVTGGSLNGSITFTMEVTKVGSDTSLAQIIRLVEDAQGSKAPISRLADKVSGIFVPAVLGIALITAVIWLLCGASFSFSLTRFISVLVIACPCALGLATPTAIMVGTGRAAKNGILIKSGEALELAHALDTLVFDKTGTITNGKPIVTEVIPYGLTEEKFLRFFGSCEQYSEHPLGKTIVEYCQSKNIEFVPCQNYKAVAGKGAIAILSGHPVFIGNEALMEDHNINIPDEIRKLKKSGYTILMLAVNRKFRGCICVFDALKNDATETIDTLRCMNIRTVLLTGDNEVVAKTVGKLSHISKVFPNVLPDHKAKYIQKIQSEGSLVGMVGDGINDAIALTTSNVGIAIGNGTDVAISSADIVLMRNDLMSVVDSIRISKATMRIIKQNLFWAFFYNCITIPLAAGVFYTFGGPLLSPMIAALCMSFSSVTVLANALRLKVIKLK